MSYQGLGELLADGVDRVERGHGLLKNHGDIVSPYSLNIFSAQLQQILSVEQDSALGAHCAHILKQPQNRHGGNGFPGTGFPDQGMGFSLLNTQVNIVEDPAVAADFLIGTESQRKIINGK